MIIISPELQTGKIVISMYQILSIGDLSTSTKMATGLNAISIFQKMIEIKTLKKY
jgi:hypothetical protein